MSALKTRAFSPVIKIPRFTKNAISLSKSELTMSSRAFCYHFKVILKVFFWPVELNEITDEDTRISTN